jgi:arsenite methyltransferase
VTTAGPGPRPRYGVDGFPYVVALSVTAALLPAGALALRRGTRQRGLAAAALAVGAAAAVPAALGIRYTARGKSALRERVLDAVRWRGDETVVDLGAGAGLLGLGAAGRTAGVVHCVDLFPWSVMWVDGAREPVAALLAAARAVGRERGWQA